MITNTINGKKLKDKAVAWLKAEFEKTGRDTAVVGCSGGKDSSVVIALCVEALGAENVVAVLMPNGRQDDFADATELVHHTGVRHAVVNISEPYQAFVKVMDPLSLSEQARINLAPRIRMATLYAVAQSLDGKSTVVGTGNRSEAYVGYFTKWGDGAHDINPLQNLWVDEVIAVGDALGLPHHLVHKAPSDGLCGKTDEESLGVTYAEIKAYATTGTCGFPGKDALIEQMHQYSEHKRNPIPGFKNK